MSLERGRKPEYQEETHAYTGRTCKLQSDGVMVGIMVFPEQIMLAIQGFTVLLLILLVIFFSADIRFNMLLFLNHSFVALAVMFLGTFVNLDRQHSGVVSSTFA